MNPKLKTILIIVATLISSLLGVKGYTYLPEFGDSADMLYKVESLEQQIDDDWGEITQLRDELKEAMRQLGMSKDPNMVYDSSQDVYMPRSWVTDPKDVEIDDLKSTIQGMEDQRKRTLMQMIVHSNESTDQILEINRLQDELWKANEGNEGKDVWPCGTPKDPNEANEVLSFPDLVEQVIDGVVHIGVPGVSQGSGFVIGPRLIGTAGHVVKGQTNFLITTNDGHILKATRGISRKGCDTGYIYIDDLTCISEQAEDISCRKGGHEVTLQVLELGRLKNCRLGQEVFSIGSTAGSINFNAVAKGSIQTLHPTIGELNTAPSGWKTLFGMTPEGGGGNSGCPVFTMDGKVIGVWVGSNQPNLHYAVPVDVFVEDIDAIMLMFIQDNYQIEKTPDNTVEMLRNQVAELQRQVSYLQQDERLQEVYEWYRKVKDNITTLLNPPKPVCIVTVSED